MAADVSIQQATTFEMASPALNAGVIEYLNAVLDRGGTPAFDMVASNLMTDVSLILVQQLGPSAFLNSSIISKLP